MRVMDPDGVQLQWTLAALVVPIVCTCILWAFRSKASARDAHKRSQQWDKMHQMVDPPGKPSEEAIHGVLSPIEPNVDSRESIPRATPCTDGEAQETRIASADASNDQEASRSRHVTTVNSSPTFMDPTAADHDYMPQRSACIDGQVQAPIIGSARATNDSVPNVSVRDSSVTSTPGMLPTAGFPVGTFVRVSGICARPELNGLRGRIIVAAAPNGRIGVKLEGMASTMSLKPMNLTAIRVKTPTSSPATAGVSSAPAISDTKKVCWADLSRLAQREFQNGSSSSYRSSAELAQKAARCAREWWRSRAAPHGMLCSESCRVTKQATYIYEARRTVDSLRRSAQCCCAAPRSSDRSVLVCMGRAPGCSTWCRMQSLVPHAAPPPAFNPRSRVAPAPASHPLPCASPALVQRAVSNPLLHAGARWESSWTAPTVWTAALRASESSPPARSVHAA